MQVSFKYGKAANVKTKSNLCDLCDLCIQELWKIAAIFAIITWSLSAYFGHPFQKCLVQKSIRIFLQLNQYETVPYFNQLSKNLTSDWFSLAETEAKPPILTLNEAKTHFLSHLGEKKEKKYG